MKKILGFSFLAGTAAVAGYVGAIYYVGSRIDRFANHLHFDDEVDLP